jgi:5-methylcytosine-specific restriction enzyme A
MMGPGSCRRSRGGIMARAVKEWIGATPDSKIPDRVKLRIWDREDGRCYLTGRKIMPSDAYDFEHVIAIALWVGDGHGNRESNIRLALRDKHREKTALDVREKAVSARKRKKHLGIRKPSKLQSRGFAKAPPQRSASRPLSKRAAQEQS